MDVISLPVEFDEKKIDSRYRLTIAVAKRARELHNGAMPRIASNAKKLTTVALEEVLSGSVRVLSGEAAVKAKEKAEKLTHEDVMDEAEQRASFPEALTELEKEVKVYLHKKEQMDNKETTEEILPEKGS